MNNIKRIRHTCSLKIEVKKTRRKELKEAKVSQKRMKKEHILSIKKRCCFIEQSRTVYCIHVYMKLLLLCGSLEIPLRRCIFKNSFTKTQTPFSNEKNFC